MTRVLLVDNAQMPGQEIQIVLAAPDYGFDIRGNGYRRVMATADGAVWLADSGGQRYGECRCRCLARCGCEFAAATMVEHVPVCEVCAFYAVDRNGVIQCARSGCIDVVCDLRGVPIVRIIHGSLDSEAPQPSRPK